MEQDNSHIILTEPIQWAKNQAGCECPPDSPIISLFFSERTQLLFATYMGGQTYVGRLKEDYCEVNSYFLVSSSEQLEDKQKENFVKNGTALTNFRETSDGLKGANGKQEFYILAMSRVIGQLQAVPMVLKISDSTVQIQMLRTFT
jgi:hypothetical protein